MSKNNRLAVFFTFDVSLDLWRDRGLLSREVELYKRMCQNGWEVIFITYGGKEDLEIAKQISPIKVVPLFKKLKPRTPIGKLLLSPLLVLRIHNQLKQCDALKTNQIWGGWNAVLGKWASKRPLVLRGGYEPYAFSKHQRQSKVRQIFTKYVTKFCYLNADIIFLATTDDFDFARSHFNINSNDVFIRSNWVDTEKFKPRNNKRPTSDILYVGRLNAQKNLHSLIRSLKGSSYTLHLVGDGEQRQELEKIANELSVSTVFHGRLPNDTLSKFIAEFEIFVLPSLFEGNPKVLIEAMSAGLAVVACDSPGINTLIKNEVNGLLCPPTKDGLRTAIDQLQTSNGLRSSLGKNARSYALANHSLEKFVGEEEKLIEYTIKKKKYEN